MAKDFMHQSTIVELDENSTTLSGNFNENLGILDRKIVLIVASGATERDKVTITTTIGDYAISVDTLTTAVSGTTTDENTGATVAYKRYDLTTIPLTNLTWSCDPLTTAQVVTIQFLGGTF